MFLGKKKHLPLLYNLTFYIEILSSDVTGSKAVMRWNSLTRASNPCTHFLPHFNIEKGGEKLSGHTTNDDSMASCLEHIFNERMKT